MPTEPVEGSGKQDQRQMTDDDIDMSGLDSL